ncbi:hypothetical protein [Halomicronema sp. CCY15110]|uniref:hypothetical protein n=1 Tax=Halomicronema sp. CCY15110 TaxID=2767773 RepID=UPI00194E4463|nr:hypothetical protein [Halomicronema sp. CCY15110]
MSSSVVGNCVACIGPIASVREGRRSRSPLQRPTTPATGRSRAPTDVYSSYTENKFS